MGKKNQVQGTTWRDDVRPTLVTGGEGWWAEWPEFRGAWPARVSVGLYGFNVQQGGLLIQLSLRDLSAAGLRHTEVASVARWGAWVAGSLLERSQGRSRAAWTTGQREMDGGSGNLAGAHVGDSVL